MGFGFLCFFVNETDFTDPLLSFELGELMVKNLLNYVGAEGNEVHMVKREIFVWFTKGDCGCVNRMGGQKSWLFVGRRGFCGQEGVYVTGRNCEVEVIARLKENFWMVKGVP
jgi:hypothetical protein